MITTRHRTPRFPHSLATLDTWADGTATTTRSGTVGRSETDGRHGTPSISSACGFTANSAPAKPAPRMLSRIVRPMDPSRRLAPTTATDRGASSGARLATSARCSRPATASR